MKRLSTFILGLALSAFATATTLTPVQLLNPSGSTSGQVITSTGPSTAPAWGSVSLSGGVTGTLAIGNGGTGATTAANARTNLGAAPLTSPVFSGDVTVSGNYLGAGSGYTIATTTGLANGGAIQLFDSTHGSSVSILNNGAQVGNFTSTGLNNSPIGATTASSGAFTTLTASSTITPSSTAGIVGTTTNDSANAGSVGEYITATGTGVSMTSGTVANITSISLTAGDWDVTGNVILIAAGSTIIQGEFVGISTTSATLPAQPGYAGASGLSLGAGALLAFPAPVTRISISSTTTVYLVTNALFSTSTLTATGTIRARRVR